jgi:hypothetical protein
LALIGIRDLTGLAPIAPGSKNPLLNGSDCFGPGPRIDSCLAIAHRFALATWTRLANRGQSVLAALRLAAAPLPGIHGRADVR